MYPVVFENVSKLYEGKEILHEINLQIDENKITAIIGRSGSGKSTILKLINGLVVQSHGKIDIFEEKIEYDKIIETRLKIGYSVQGTALFPHMNVYDNITLLARLNNWSKNDIEERVTKLMSLVNLPTDFRKKYPHELSGGEQQRVGICRAMMLNPKIFLLDEAFGALDPTTKSEIHSELLKIQMTEPRTILLVTHDLYEAFKLADKIIILEKGIIQQTGTKDEIQNSSNEFVKYFVKAQFK
ncbi:MAG: ATP-binding cassette domain-containing protein [Ignavibacteria bacterium]|nr:ATP-binding cassette domain-containing protein [Ignavibacteria bacterium]